MKPIIAILASDFGSESTGGNAGDLSSMVLTLKNQIMMLEVPG